MQTILMKMTDLHENETACRTHFYMKDFALSRFETVAQEKSEMAYFKAKSGELLDSKTNFHTRICKRDCCIFQRLIT